MDDPSTCSVTPHLIPNLESSGPRDAEDIGPTLGDEGLTLRQPPEEPVKPLRALGSGLGVIGTAAITVERLRKDYDEVHAVDGLSFVGGGGGVFAPLGPTEPA